MIAFFINRVYVEQSRVGHGLDLIFRNLNPSDDGQYACTATLDGKKEHRNFSLNVIGKYVTSNTVSSSNKYLKHICDD